MKTFEQYLFESKLAASDYSKHDGKYLKSVLSTIANTGKIGLGSERIDTELVIDDATKAKFAEYTDDPTSLTLDEFNRIAKSNSTPFVWTRIFKGVHSGQEHQSDGEYAEAAVAYIYNAMNGNKQIVESDDDSFAEIVQTLSDKNITADWISSSRLSAQKLQTQVQKPKTYVAAHVDGKDISKVNDNVLKVAKIFKGKSGIKEVLGSKIDNDALNNLYVAGKDTWNKADIVLVNNKLDIEKELSGKHFAISDEFNKFLNELILKKLIYPVSLKKIKPKATLDQIKFEAEGNIQKVEKTESELDQIKKVDVILPQTVTPKEKYVGSAYLKTNNGMQIDFRHGTAQRESLNIEIKLKTARGGKALAELKRKLNLASDFYKSYGFPKEEDFLSELKRLTGNNIQPKDSLRKSDKKWFIRPAFKGLIALLSIFQANVQQNNKKVNLVEFFKLLYNCASGANSDSIFYLLTMK